MGIFGAKVVLPRFLRLQIRAADIGVIEVGKRRHPIHHFIKRAYVPLLAQDGFGIEKNGRGNGVVGGCSLVGIRRGASAERVAHECLEHARLQFEPSITDGCSRTHEQRMTKRMHELLHVSIQPIELIISS